MKKRKLRVIWAIVSSYTNYPDVCWGNYESRSDARIVCKHDNEYGDRKGRVVKFIEADRKG